MANDGVGLILSGGGAKGAYHIGLIKALKNSGIKPSFIGGASIGSLVGAAATYNFDSPEVLWELWNELTMESVLGVKDRYARVPKNMINVSLIFDTFIEWWKNKGIDINKLRTLLNDNLDAEKILASNIDFGLLATTRPGTLTFKDNWKNLAKELIFSKDKFETHKIYKSDMQESEVFEYILASVYLMIYSQEPLLDGHYYTDLAGTKDGQFPSVLLEGKDFDTIFISYLSSKVRPFEKMQLEKSPDNNPRAMWHVIKPSEPPISPLNFTSEATTTMYQMGYEDGMKAIESVLENTDTLEKGPKL